MAELESEELHEMFPSIMGQEVDMPVINPFDNILLSINDKFSVATEKANASRAVKYGDARYTKAEARVRFMRELASKVSGPERVELIKQRGVDASMDLLGKGGSL